MSSCDGVAKIITLGIYRRGSNPLRRMVRVY